MSDLSTLPGTAVAFSEYFPKDARAPGFELATLPGGILRSMPRERAMHLPAGQSHFGFTYRGDLEIQINGHLLWIPEGFYFCAAGQGRIQNKRNTEGIIISTPGYQAFTMFGQIEWEGRLRYINGCTDSLLISPIKMGDPCLNLLYFPPNTDQTMHTHPSDRIGMILSGEGICVTEDERGRRSTVLHAGMLFCIHTGGLHKFQTLNSELRVLAFHLDSDFGPTDEDHPMINRTMVDGISAAKLTELHTHEAPSQNLERP